MENNNNQSIFIASNTGICIKNPMRQARIIGPDPSFQPKYPVAKKSWFDWIGVGGGSSFDSTSFAVGLACGSC
jgi:hypothetical protein